MNTRKVLMFLSLLACAIVANATVRTYQLASYGILPSMTAQDMSSRLRAALNEIRSKVNPSDTVIVKFKKGKYAFHASDAEEAELYISNHDQGQPKRVGIILEGWSNLVLDGQGSEFLFYGRMLPVALIGSDNCSLQDFSIDFPHPQIAQVKIIENRGDSGIVFEPAPWVDWRKNSKGYFENYGEGWSVTPATGIAFEAKSRHIVYNTSDLGINTKGFQDLGKGKLLAPNWKDNRLPAGTIVAMRSWERPAPGIFLDHCRNTVIYKSTVHYAEGMGLLAQRCDGVSLQKFGVKLRGKRDPRYFTTQADATHFSQCKGEVFSEEGLYESMMDDAINVHGIYLKVTKRINSRTLQCSYMHGQTWGFAWGDKGDTVSFVRSSTMDTIGGYNIIKSIEPLKGDVVTGTKSFVITFEKNIPASINSKEGFGVENLSWTPSVWFTHNTIRNNRARGALFSSPRRTWCEDNVFDHTSGTAILLCGDCNGWYESGAVHSLVIRHNKFINSLTNMFQFTNAVISIYPEVPKLDKQQGYFHGGKEGSILIEDNFFETFDNPLLYAKSVKGLTFRNNHVKRNHDYPAFHWNKKQILLEHCVDCDISEARED